MPKSYLVPCECNKCFCCVKGLTNNIIHQLSTKAKVTVEYACGMGVTMNKCTSKQVKLGMLLGSYCWMWYRKLVIMELTPTERKKTAEPHCWDVPSVSGQFAKSAGKRVMINTFRKIVRTDSRPNKHAYHIDT
jgi:hypothetical protein